MIDQALTLLCNYLKIDTAQPNPDYASAIHLLRAQAVNDGFITQEITMPSGRTLLVITLEGSDPALPSLVLNHHMDVVPADASEWNSHPFDGAVIDNVIVGRGVQDMKGVGIVHYAALQALKKQRFQLQRTIHLVAVPDEEIGGFTGTGQFLESEKFTILNIGYVLDEGLPSGNDRMLYLKISERKPLQIKVCATGIAGHGSMLNAQNALHELVGFLHLLVSLQNKNKEKSSEIAPGLLLSTNITSLQAGLTKNGEPAYNVIPSSAEAIVDIRVPPAMAVDEVLKLLNEACKKFPHVSFQVLKMVSDYDAPQTDGLLYQALEAVLLKHGIHATALHFEATTDARFYCAKGIEAIGFTPFSSEPQLHGINESLDVKDFQRAIQLMQDFLKYFCTEGE